MMAEGSENHWRAMATKWQDKAELADRLEADSANKARHWRDEACRASGYAVRWAIFACVASAALAAVSIAWALTGRG